MTQGKTLKELDVKPGDVVQARGGNVVKIAIGPSGEYLRASDMAGLNSIGRIWSIVSRAANPRLTAAVAKLDAKDADTMTTVFGYTLQELHDIVSEHERRIKPEPTRETVALYGPQGREGPAIGTIVYEDGKPDPASIKMNEVE